LIYSWTGDRAAAEWGKDVLFWYALGNGVLALTALQYFLQNSFGQLKLHVVGSTISVVCQVPIIYYAASRYGAVGAGMVWFAIRVVWFICWIPIVHRKLVPGLHLDWIAKDVLPIALTSVVSISVLNALVTIEPDERRFSILIYLFALGMVQLLVTAASSSFIRSRFSNYIHRGRLVS